MTTLAQRVGGRGRVIGGPFGSKLTQADYSETGVPVIRGQNMQQFGRWIGGEFAYVSTDKFDRDLRPNAAHPGDIIVTQRGTLGQVSIVPVDYPHAVLVVSQSQMAVTVDPQSADPLFVYYWLKSRAFADYLSNATIQVGVPHINLGILRDAPADWPELAVQRRVSKVLGSLDDKLELNRRMNETLEAMAQAIFRDWFVDFGPTRRKLAGITVPVEIVGGLTLDPARAAEVAALFPDALGDNGLPVRWNPSTVADLFHVNPSEPLGRGVVAPYTDMASLPTSGCTADPPIDRAFGSGMKFKNGDALLARITPCLENGKAAFVDFLPTDQTIGWGSTEFIVFRSRPPAPLPMAYLLLRHQEFRTRAIQSMTGTSGRQRAQADSLRSFAMARAPDDLLQKFGTLVEPLFSQIRANAAQNQTLAATRDLILPKLMSGKIRLRDAAPIAQEVDT